jgi:zinc and cadmium transporter
VLLNAGFSRGKALLFNAISGMAAVVGGVLGYYLIGSFESALPYLLVLASSSFIYISVADLLPQLQQRLAWRETLAQVAWLAVGLGVALAVSQLLHGTH